MSGAAESDQAVTPNCLPPVSTSVPTADNNAPPPSLKELLESVDEFEENELTHLRNLADQLKLKDHLLDLFDRQWEITFSFDSKQDYSMWKTCTLGVLFKCKIPEISLTINSSKLEFKVTVSFDEMKEILHNLKPLAKYSKFEKISIVDENEDKVKFLSNFLAGTPIKTIEFYPRNQNSRIFNDQRSEVVNFAPWLDLVQKVKPYSVMYHRICFTQELIDFLFEVADVVENIWIGGASNPYPDDHFMPIILNILRRKCYNLYVSGGIAAVSSDQIKHMIQYFKTTDRKVRLTVPTIGDISIGDRIEDYELKEDNTSTTGNMVVIEHISIKHSGRHVIFDPTGTKSSFVALSPNARHCAIDEMSTPNDEYHLIGMLKAADERRKFLRNELTSFEENLLRENSTEYIHVDMLGVSKCSLAPDQISISFHFCSFIDLLIWDIIFDATAAKVGLTGHFVYTGNASRMTSVSLSLMWLVPDSQLDKLEVVIQMMHPLIRKTHFKSAHINAKDQGTIRICTQLLEGSSVDAIQIDAMLGELHRPLIETTHFDAWLCMIRRVKPWSILCQKFHLTKPFANFMVSTAEVVERISLAVLSYPIEPVLPTSFLRALLSRRCNNIKIWGSVAKITEDQAEELVRAFHHSGREVSLTIHILEPITETRIGMYKVEMIAHRFAIDRELLVIRHITVPENESEI